MPLKAPRHGKPASRNVERLGNTENLRLCAEKKLLFFLKRMIIFRIHPANHLIASCLLQLLGFVFSHHQMGQGFTAHIQQYSWMLS